MKNKSLAIEEYEILKALDQELASKLKRDSGMKKASASIVSLCELRQASA